MGREQNRRLEQAVFELLQCSHPELSDGVAVRGESPEFVVLRGDTRIGLEVTSLHGSDPGEGSPEVQRRVANGLFFHLVEERLKVLRAPCVVSVQLMGAIAGGGRRARAVAHDTLRVLEPAVARPGVAAQWSRLGRDTDLPPELHSLDLAWPPNLKRPFLLMGGDSFMISDDFEKPLRDVLATKNRKFELYRQRCDQCWLAVVLPHYFAAEDEGVPSPALAVNYDTPFERVLLVDLDRGRSWQVPTRNPLQNPGILS